MSLNSEHRRRKEDERVPLYPEAQAGYSNGRGQGSSGDVEEAGSPIDEDEHDDSARDDDIRKAAVFGALDGVLTSFAIVAGAAGGGLGTQAVLILGVSSIFADGLSMGLGEYLSSKAMNEYIDLERKREEWELTHHRQGEIDTMVALYMRRGMTREDAEEVLTRLSKYDQFFVNVMMAEELGLPSYAAPLDEGGSIREGLVTFASFAVSGVLPLLVYALSPMFSASSSSSTSEGMEPLSQATLFLWACVVTACALFAIGVVKASFVSRSWLGSGMETVVLGACCAGLAYEIGAVVASCVKGML